MNSPSSTDKVVADVPSTVFVVDDDPAILDSVESALRPLELPLECFSSAEIFLDQWGGPRPGCLLLDVRMAGMSGIELQRRLTASHDYLCIVIVTGHATVPLSVACLKQGAFDLLEKPYPPQVLRSVVSRAMAESVVRWNQYQRRMSYERLRDELSQREQEVYRLLLNGMENKRIARTLGISPSTVEKHRLAVVRKMGTENPAQLLSQKYDATGTLDDPSPA